MTAPLLGPKLATRDDLGTLRDRYRLVRRLGHGATADVFEALDLSLGAVVALKQLRDGAPREVARIKAEFRQLAGVHEPGLVQLYELVIDDDAAFFTMELIDGVDLTTYAEAAPLGATLHALAEVAVAIAALHRHGLRHVPSLAERVEDVVPLATGFLRHAIERHQLPYKVLSPSATRAIQAAEWPGNVRELANRIESAAIRAHVRGSDRIEIRDMFPDLGGDDGGAETLSNATRRCQRKHMLAVLASTDWNVLETARVLDLSRSQVYNLIRAFEIKRD